MYRRELSRIMKGTLFILLQYEKRQNIVLAQLRWHLSVAVLACIPVSMWGGENDSTKQGVVVVGAEGRRGRCKTVSFAELGDIMS